MSSRPTTADANREFYAEVAEYYDTSEDCVVDPRLKERLLETLRFALLQFPTGGDLQVLDACGGSGNASLMLLEMGITPLTVDISPQMLVIYETKARAAGHRPQTEVTEIDSFLRHTTRTWDLIVFASALHHLEDYRDVMSTAMDRVRPGGVIVTMFDPTRVGRLGLALRRVDYLVHLATEDFARFVARVLSRLQAVVRPRTDHSENVGALAERYALAGVDDRGLAGLAVDRNWQILRHARFYEARFRLSRLIFRAARQASSFSLVLRAPGDHRGERTSR
jgi:SAM-dependent methyltransferase